MEKVRPAVNCIRFLTLSVTDIVRTSLLTQEEKMSIVETVSSHDDLSKMPTDLSVLREKRETKVFVKESVKNMICCLNDIYTTKYCCYCKLKNWNYDHAIWYCRYAETEELENIYTKYNHNFLFEYEPADVKKIFEIFKANKYIK